MNFKLCLLSLALLTGGIMAQEFTASGAGREELGAKKAFDGDMATRWSSAFDQKTGWIQVRYDRVRRFDQVELKSGIRDLKGAPKSFRILAGDKDDELKEIGRMDGNGADPALLRFPLTEAIIWRIDITEVINTRWSPTISEIVFAKTGAVTVKDPLSGLRPTVRSSNPGTNGHGPELVVDGNRSSLWISKDKGKAWLEFEYDEPVRADAFLLDVRARGGHGVAKDLRLQIKKGRSFKTIFKAKDVHRNLVREVFKSTEAKVWRLEISSVVNDRGTPRLGEFRLAQLGENGWPDRAKSVADPRAVNKAIDRGVAWLIKEQNSEGLWPIKYQKEYPMGVLALTGLAIKKSGRPSDDPVLYGIQKKLAAMPLTKTYSVALYAMFLRSMSKKQHLARIGECAEFLVERQGSQGLWGYPDGRTDLSNAQYALLGLKAARDVGIKVPSKPFKKSFDWLAKGARHKGGFNYVPHGDAAKDPPTGSMTAAALACLRICLDALPKDRGRQSKGKKIAERAFKWIEGHFTVSMNPGSHMSHFYWLYGLERVGSYWKKKEIGGRDWYEDGAAYLLEWQDRDGSWYRNHVDTCFALLFLNRASLTD